LYSVYAPDSDGWSEGSSDYYEEDFLYDLKKDPYELNNLVRDPEYKEIRSGLAKQLIAEMVKAGEKAPVINPTKH
ncbi:MAG: sulfatase/phosphatase domain-containing protein, partial [Oliverpabstia sp.]